MFIRFSYCALLFVSIQSLASSAVLTKGDKCSLQDGSDGICRLLKECTTAVQMIKKNVNPVICGYQESESIVCCKNDNVTSTSTSSTTTGSLAFNRTPGDTSKQKCKEYAKYAYEMISSPTLLLKPHYTKKLACDIQRNRLVVGSTLAARKEFPHMALVGYYANNDKNNGTVWLCGGSLISENFVVTAAYCTVSRDHGVARLVRVGFTNKSDPTHMQERVISEVITHPKYHYPIKYHDISLLRLSKNVEFNTYVRPACLHTEHYIPYVLAITSGWGSASGKDVQQSNDLLATVLEFYDVDTCNNTYKIGVNRRALQEGIVDDLMICAGISKSVRSTCQGDGGGPLQVYHKETEDVECMYDIIGIVSFGKPCGVVKNVPDVFTRVSAYIKWIEDIVWPS